jgi:outer membrane receptor protein involved in Fe transport
MEVHRAASGLLAGGAEELHIKSKDSPVTPKFSAKYEITPQAMVYATVAKGFREGGPNAPVPDSPACDASLELLGRTEAPATFNSDKLWSYEIGAKFRTDDRKFQFTGAVYQINWSDVQQTINLTTGGCGFSYTDNVGDARSRGFEIETIYNPFDGLSLTAAVGHTDAQLTEDLVTGADDNGPIVAAEEGTRLAFVPNWTVSLSGQYDFDLSDTWQGFARAEYLYQGDVKRHLNTPSDDPASLNRDSYGLVNLRFGVMSGGNEFNVFVNNVLDEDSLIYKTYLAFAPGTAYEAVRVRPRVIGVSYRRDF